MIIREKELTSANNDFMKYWDLEFHDQWQLGGA